MPLRTREFLQSVKDLLPALLPSALANFQSRVVFTSLQIYYWYPRIHYEVWPVRKTGYVEIGLHFEGEREESYRWAAALGERAPEIQAILGPQVELEAWTPSWTRLHLTLPIDELDQGLAETAAQKLAAVIATVQPILEEVKANLDLPELEPTAAAAAPYHRHRHYRQPQRRRGKAAPTR